MGIVVICIVCSVVTAAVTAKILAKYYLNIFGKHIDEMWKMLRQFTEEVLQKIGKIK